MSPTHTAVDAIGDSSTRTPPPAPAPPAPGFERLAHLPIGVFAIVMGLAGTSLAWRRAASVLALPAAVGQVLAWIALLTFLGLGITYLSKVFRRPAAVRAEWQHPAKVAFVPTVTISLLILAAAFLDEQPRLSAGLWWIGAGGQLMLTLYVLRFWLSEAQFSIAHVHPAWFIPVVGNLVVPLAGTTHASVDISWFFFAVGLLYWLTLTPLILYRVILAGPLPDRLRPTLAIMVAPPAVAALAWGRLGGSPLDPFGRILLAVAIFQALLLATQARSLIRVPFAVPSWAYSFPLAALTSALLIAAQKSGTQTDAGQVDQWLGGTALGLLSVLVVALSARTLLAVRRHEICRPD